MSIPALGGEPTGAATTAARAQVRRQAAAGSPDDTGPLLDRDEAIVVELGDEQRTRRLEVADGWITTAKPGSLETRGAAQLQRSGRSEPTAGAGSAARVVQTAPKRESAGEPVTLERLVVVLKRTGIEFRDAYQVLREIRAGAPLPPRAELRALWATADPAAWEERARVRAAADQEAPQHQVDARGTDADLGRTPVDDVIRDRSWHRAAEQDPATTSTPTLQTITQPTSANQAYVADLSTAEFQRLVAILGGTAPEWFWALRDHRGIRRLAERPSIARLNATRIAGTRLGAWILAILGTALLWYVGVRTGTWW